MVPKVYPRGNNPESDYVQEEAIFRKSKDLSKSSNCATVTTIDSLNLKTDDVFGYWFDFADDWWHQINMASIQSRTPTGEYPKVIERIGESPSQYQDIN